MEESNQTQEESDPVCAICLLPLFSAPTGTLVELSCHHTFHLPCMKQWILHCPRNLHCPLCRGPPTVHGQWYPSPNTQDTAMAPTTAMSPNTAMVPTTTTSVFTGVSSHATRHFHPYTAGHTVQFAFPTPTPLELPTPHFTTHISHLIQVAQQYTQPLWTLTTSRTLTDLTDNPDELCIRCTPNTPPTT
jgi:hypothetical protein